MILFLFHCLLFKVRIQISSIHSYWLIKLLCLFSLQMPPLPLLSLYPLISWALSFYFLKKLGCSFKCLIFMSFLILPTMVLWWCSTDVSVFSVNWIENLINSKFYFFMKLFCKRYLINSVMSLIQVYIYGCFSFLW